MKLPPPGLAAPPGFQNSSAAQHLPPNNLGEKRAPVIYNPCPENMPIDQIVLLEGLSQVLNHQVEDHIRLAQTEAWD